MIEREGELERGPGFEKGIGAQTQVEVHAQDGAKAKIPSDNPITAATVLSRTTATLSYNKLLKGKAVYLRCPHCDQWILTRIKHRPGIKALLMCCLTALIGWWACLCCLPLCCGRGCVEEEDEFKEKDAAKTVGKGFSSCCCFECRDSLHFCPLCEDLIGIYER